ncbi:Homocysteine S-methyltransferase 2 [Hibiscus syriacus]|uniref:Homocysteine S-methyltransferase 2 n=1 Tax=Hibiscus syriacus TaxID=106335 RepID=A0A6A3BZJ9_HIBSY|nr:Homocysteine S-methyltransferase 2 [Hibiscus syriacus]
MSFRLNKANGGFQHPGDAFIDEGVPSSDGTAYWRRSWNATVLTSTIPSGVPNVSSLLLTSFAPASLDNLPNDFEQVHLDYLEAGVDIIITASYQATIQGFEAKGFSREQSESLLKKSVEIAIEARQMYFERCSKSSNDGIGDGKVLKKRPIKKWRTLTVSSGCTLAGLMEPDFSVDSSLFGGWTDQNLDYFPPNLRDGIPTVCPPSEILEEGISEWRLSLVGQFLGVAPSFTSLHRTVESLWSKALLGSQLQVSSAGNNIFVFSFSSESARDWVLQNGPWHVHNKPLILRNWEPNLKRLSFSLSKIPVWVHLFNVPLELFSRTGLSYIASAIGIPISTDTITATKSRLEFAKVCIEIGVKDVIPKLIEVVLKDGQTTSINVEKKAAIPNIAATHVGGIEVLQEPEKFAYQPTATAEANLQNINDSIDAAKKDTVVGGEANARRKEVEIEVNVPDQIEKLNYANDAATKNTKEVTAADSSSVNVPTSDHETHEPTEVNEVGNEQPAVLKRGRSRPLKENAKTQFSGSSNRFELLNSAEEIPNSLESFQRKRRAASLGVHSFVEFIAPGVSDHCMSLTWLFKEVPANKPKPFKFFNFWAAHPNFINVVSQSWLQPAHGNPMQILLTKLKRLKECLTRFNKENYSMISDRVKLKRIELENQQLLILKRQETIEKELLLQEELNTLEVAEVAFLKQKAKRDTIGVLVDDQGNRLESFEAMSKEIISFYFNLIGTADNMVKDIDPNLLKDLLNYSLPYEASSSLVKEITREEIQKVVFCQGNDKAPGPDGFTPFFFKNSWNIVNEDVVAAVKFFFLSATIHPAFNSTIIALVPKIPNPSAVKDYRPISYCSVIYKIITKIIVRRLTDFLPDIITLNQTAFIRGRSIIDNTLLAQEMVKGYGRKSISPRCALKIDLHKAFDSIHWGFIIQILKALNLPLAFIAWIEACFTEAWFSISFNGTLIGYFKGARGLRQGDPLSPYLFVLAMNILSRMLNLAAERGIFGFHPKCRKIGLTHLSFADDLLVFCKGNIDSVVGVLTILDRFYEVFGLKLNPAKCEIFVAGIPTRTIENLRIITGFQIGSLPIRYLGIPLVTRKLTEKDCQALIDNIKLKLHHWSSRNLSYAGRLELIRSVLFNVSNYWCRQLVLPTSILKKVDQICSRYFWKGADKFVAGARVSWDNICVSKSEGGLRLKNIKTWNKACLIILIRKFLAGNGSLWCPILVAASVGSYGAYLADGSEYSGHYGDTMTVKALKEFHRRRVQVLAESGPDLIAFETVPNKIEAQAYAELLEEEHLKIPAWFTFNSKDGVNVVSGDSLLHCASIAESFKQVVAVGINCTPSRFILDLILEIKKQNSGVKDEDFISYVSKWCEVGVSLVGGCCSTPNTIKAIYMTLSHRSPAAPKQKLAT